MAGAGEVGDGPTEQGVLGRVERSAEDAGDERGGEALAAITTSGVVAGARVHRVEPVGAAGSQLDDGQAVPNGEREVLALRVEDGDEPPCPVHGERSAEERLDGGRLARADVAGDDHVRVGQHAAAVELEGVEVEPAHPAGDVDAEVRPRVADRGRRHGTGRRTRGAPSSPGVVRCAGPSRPGSSGGRSLAGVGGVVMACSMGRAFGRAGARRPSRGRGGRRAGGGRAATGRRPVRGRRTRRRARRDRAAVTVTSPTKRNSA